jgi:hypothetical protein
MNTQTTEIDDAGDARAETPTSIACLALATLSSCCETRDLEALLASFSEQPSATYAGSEQGEVATGRAAIRSLLNSLLQREAHYSFSFPSVLASPVGQGIWVVAEGTGQEITPEAVTPFPYRVCGVLRYEHPQWRWVVLTGAEPTPPPPATIEPNRP